MNQIEKNLKKLKPKEQERALKIISLLILMKWEGLGIIQLKGHKDFYRVRFGSCRIIFSCINRKVEIIFVGRRNESTYRNF